MPQKKNMNDYLNGFYRSLVSHYGKSSITPEIYQKEVLNFIKKLDPEFALNNIIDFINKSAYDVINVVGTDGLRLAQDDKLYPQNFIGNLLEKNIPSKEVYEAMSSKMTKNAYVNYCNQLIEDPGKGPKSSVIEYKMNMFKMLEALKPTGNKVTVFFKKFFNIGGYNDKLAAYENCKQSIRTLVGEGLTNEEFEANIQDLKRFSSASLKKEKEEKNVKVDLSKEFENKEEKEPIEVNDVKEKEVNKDLVNEPVKSN